MKIETVPKDLYTSFPLSGRQKNTYFIFPPKDIESKNQLEISPMLHLL